MNCISLKEYDHLHAISAGGDVPDRCFNWLKNTVLFRQKDGQQEFLRFSTRQGKESLQVINYVGILQTPDGTCLEILPKIAKGKQQRDQAVRLLFKMLRVVHELPALDTTDADLSTKDRPLLEILISIFLKHVADLVHKGIRSDYQRVHDTRAFLKGRLNVARQIRQPSTKQHLFCIEYDQYQQDRPENRLIRSALDQVLKWTNETVNQRLARELSFSFAEISPSPQYVADFNRWSVNRDMVYYQPVLPWIKLILATQTPWFMKDQWAGVSLLFPMQQLYEKYLGHILNKQLPKGFTLIEQASRYSLAEHKGSQWFKLKPDFVITVNKQTAVVMDAKWKLLEASKGNSREKYGLSQADFYQLFAYGQKYLPKGGELFLIYPKYEQFEIPLPEFIFSEKLKLWVVPFDMENDQVVFPEELDFIQYEAVSNYG